MGVKILVVIPCLYGPEHCKEAIDSVNGRENVSVLLIDNGATDFVKNVINSYQGVFVIHNQENIYVTAAWQQGIEFFLEHEQYTHLIIMNSDLIMHSQWSEVVIKRWEKSPDEIILPIIGERRVLPVNTDIDIEHRPTSGTPGVFITLNRTQANLVSPLPTELKVWFSDNWIFEICRGLGYQTVIPYNLFSHHYHSATIQFVPGISEIIEADKVSWKEAIQPRMIKFIEDKKGSYIKYKEII